MPKILSEVTETNIDATQPKSSKNNKQQEIEFEFYLRVNFICLLSMFDIT